MTHTVMPDRIVLWLSKDEFSEENIPEILKRQRAKGLTIDYCTDVKSYRKIIPTTQFGNTSLASKAFQDNTNLLFG